MPRARHLLEELNESGGNETKNRRKNDGNPIQLVPHHYTNYDVNHLNKPVKFNKENIGKSTNADDHMISSANQTDASIPLISGISVLQKSSADISSTKSKSLIPVISNECFSDSKVESTYSDFPESPNGEQVCKSPTADFDGSFEISSQMLSVIEGTTYHTSKDLQQLEQQRVVMRIEQETKAEHCFKPLYGLDSHLFTHRRFPVESTIRRISHEPPKPGLLWRSRQLGCRKVIDLIPYRTSFSVEKEPNFMNDFLKINDSSFSASSASSLRFKLDSGNDSVSYNLGDGVDVIPDDLGYAGCAEIVR